VLLLVVLTTRWGDLTAWRWVVAALPPASAARAVSRIALFFPLAAAIVLGIAADRSRHRRLVLGVLLVAALEQLSQVRYHRRDWRRAAVAEIAGQVRPASSAFFVTRTSSSPPSYATQLDAMFASSRVGVPTVNGHSGSFPAGWRLRRIGSRSGPAVEAGLAAWRARWRLAPRDVQRIEVPVAPAAPAR
jgi:hypothetical protein